MRNEKKNVEYVFVSDILCCLREEFNLKFEQRITKGNAAKMANYFENTNFGHAYPETAKSVIFLISSFEKFTKV